VRIRYAGWSTGMIWGVPAGAPAGSEWTIAIESQTSREHRNWTAFVRDAARTLKASHIDILNWPGVVDVIITLEREDVDAQFDDTNWQRLPGDFLARLEAEVSRLAGSGA